LFFSSRRRHTRSKRDWSSDVCSSDLAEQEIGILAYSALFLADDPGIVELLAASARNGVRVQILVGSPDSPTVTQRGEEEGIGDEIGRASCREREKSWVGAGAADEKHG